MEEGGWTGATAEEKLKRSLFGDDEGINIILKRSGFADPLLGSLAIFLFPLLCLVAMKGLIFLKSRSLVRHGYLKTCRSTP